MAIGKVNAYATVQAPNVDFGEIALNAQKFQDADIEKQKELKVAQLKAEKEKPFVFTPQTFKNDSGLDFYNISKIDDANKVVGDYYELSKLNEAGKLDTVGASKLSALKQNFENADNALKTVGAKYTEYVKGIKDHSGAYKATEDYLQGFTADNGKNVIRSTDSNGNPYFQQAEIDSKTKRPVIGEDGKPVIKKFIDKDGIERDGWGHADILSGRAFEPLNTFDDKGFATDVAKLVGPEKTGTDNGVTKVVREKLNAANVSTINTLIDTQVLNNPDHLKDVLYKLDPVKYKDPRAEYTDEDKAFAKKGMENSIYGGISLSKVTDVSISDAIALRKEAKEKQEAWSWGTGGTQKGTITQNVNFNKEQEKAKTTGKTSFFYNGKQYDTSKNYNATSFTVMPKTMATNKFVFGGGIPVKAVGSRTQTGLMDVVGINKSNGKVYAGIKTLKAKGLKYTDKNGKEISYDFAIKDPEQLSESSKQQFDKDLTGYGSSDIYDYDNVEVTLASTQGLITKQLGVSTWDEAQALLRRKNKSEIDAYKSKVTTKAKSTNTKKDPLGLGL